MAKSHSKVIVLVFANEDNCLFSFLKKCWLTFCHKHPDFKVFFVYGKGSGLGNEPWDLCYEHLPENHRQGILKVLHGMEYIDQNYTCDYFVHTNLSTFWDFDQLLKRLEGLGKPFVTGVPAVTPKVHGGVYLMGYNLIMDGETFSRLTSYKDDMIKIKDHPIVKALTEDKMLSVYLTDVFEMKYIDCSRNHRGNKFITMNLNHPRFVEKCRERGIDHFRVKHSYTHNERLGIDDVLFKTLCEKYYGVTFKE